MIEPICWATFFWFVTHSFPKKWLENPKLRGIETNTLLGIKENRREEMHIELTNSEIRVVKETWKYPLLEKKCYNGYLNIQPVNSNIRDRGLKPVHLSRT